MRIDLGQLSVQGLSLELPGAAGQTQDNQVSIERGEALRGVMVQTASAFQLSNVSAASMLLAKLDWLFGKLRLSTEQSAELRGLTLDVGNAGGELELELELSGLSSLRLHVGLPPLRLTARLEASQLTLGSGTAVGVLRAEHAVFSDLELRTPTLSVALPRLEVHNLVLDWGGQDFKLEAGRVESGELSLERAGTKLRGSGLTASELSVVGSSVRVGSARIARLDVEASLAAPTSTPTPEPQAASADTVQRAPLFDLELLNGLAGRLNVDVAVDLAVPIIGRRRATHELRIVIEDGALDYRELEGNLARLEDSLLDFSVRDGALVLERGLPLISTRGRGKPIVLWDLGAEDLALALQDRVRLAVLPTARLASSSGQSEPPSPPRDDKEGGGGGLKLRHLSLQEIDAALSLTASASSGGKIQALSFGNLTVRGTVHHDPDGPKRGGQLKAGIEGLRTTVRDVPIGAQTLAAQLELGALRDVTVEFEDVRPLSVRTVVEGLVIEQLLLA